MSKECEIIRDLLPLYVDHVVSDSSREIIEDHLPDCPGCRDFLKELQSSELENRLRDEKHAVIEYGAKRFRRRSAAVGSAVSGFIMVPILVLLAVNLISELTMNWFFVAIASMAVLASLVVTPLVVSRDKLFWSFCAFCVSLLALLAVTCLYAHGDWFWVASSAVLFGLSVVSLPFVLKARPVRRLVGDKNRALIALGVDAVLFVNMLYTISHRNSFGGLAIGIAVCAGFLLYETFGNGQKHAD